MYFAWFAVIVAGAMARPAAVVSADRFGRRFLRLNETNTGRFKMIVTSVVGVVLYLAIIVALVQKYRTTSDHGFLWLGLPLVLMPLLRFPLAHWLSGTVNRLAKGEHVGFFPFTLVERAEMTIGSLVALLGSVQDLVWSGLILIAILMLHQTRPTRTLSRA